MIKGDRFYFENGGTETIFTHVQLAELRKISLGSLICSKQGGQSEAADDEYLLFRINHQLDFVDLRASNRQFQWNSAWTKVV